MDEFLEIIKPLLKHPEILRLSGYTQHRKKTRLGHSIEVAWYSYKIAKFFNSDVKSITRGALLHDLYWYEWRKDSPKWHSVRHPKLCLTNAEKIFELNPMETDIIKKHMWPLTIFLPLYLESWIVCMVDTFVALLDFVPIKKLKLPDALNFYM